MRARTIYQSNTALGGESWRVTSDGATARIQSRDVMAARYTTRRTMPHDAFAAAAEASGLDYRYNDNPAILARLAQDDVGFPMVGEGR